MMNRVLKIIKKKMDTPPLKPERLDQAMLLYDELRHEEALEEIYSSIPSGECAGCTACCLESVNTNFAEFIHIVDYMEYHDLWKHDLLKKILDFYILELAKPMKCPFLEDGKCLIYDVRPLQCRIFGSYDPESYEEDYQAVLKENIQISDDFQEAYGFRLSEALVNRKLDHCKKYRAERIISKEERIELNNALFNLDAFYMGEGLMKEEEWGLSLMAWFGRMAFGRERASELRVNAARDYVENSDISWIDEISIEGARVLEIFVDTKNNIVVK